MKRREMSGPMQVAAFGRGVLKDPDRGLRVRDETGGGHMYECDKTKAQGKKGSRIMRMSFLLFGFNSTQD